MKNFPITALIAIGAVVLIISAVVYRQSRQTGSPVNQFREAATQTTPGSSESIGKTGDAQSDQEGQAADQQLNNLDSQINSLDQNLGQ